MVNARNWGSGGETSNTLQSGDLENKIILKCIQEGDRLYGWELDSTGSRLCPMAGIEVLHLRVMLP
jgi:hypothetical protein